MSVAKMAQKLPELATLASAKLKDFNDVAVTASQLWATAPVVVFIVRRPGCVLCREEALRLQEHKAEFEALGVKLAAVTKEWLPEEIAAFSPKFWPSESLYLDEDRVFFKAINGGHTHKISLFHMLNPFSQAWKNTRRAQKTVTDSNLKGEGTIAGGLVVVKAGSGGVVYSHLEKTFGDHAPLEEVLAAAKEAAQA